MSFWDKIGSGLAAVGLAEAADVTAQTPTKPQVSAPAPVSVPAPAPTTEYGSDIEPSRARELDEKARSIIVMSLKENNAPLVEEISDSLDTLAEVVDDEDKRYRTALKMLVKGGHPVAAVLGDFDKCLGALDDTQRTFQENMKQALDSQVGAKIRAVDGLNAEIAALQAQLSEKISRRDQEQSGITTEQTKITQAQSRFTIVYNNIRADIEQKRTKIARFGEGL